MVAIDLSAVIGPGRQVTCSLRRMMQDKAETWHSVIKLCDSLTDMLTVQPDSMSVCFFLKWSGAMLFFVSYLLNITHSVFTYQTTFLEVHMCMLAYVN